MPEKKDNTALLAVGGLAAVGTLGYFFWYAPRVAARRQIEATMLANAKKAQASGAPNWNGPYWKNATVPKDPWGNEYKYSSPGTHGTAYDIVSLGADGREGGEGPNKDITSW